MAVTAAASELTDAHRLAQLRLGARTITRLAAAWPVLDPAALDVTFGPWLAVVSPIVTQARAQSSRLAGQYLRTFRALELGLADTAGFTPVLAGPTPASQIATSMLVTGPAAIRSARARGVSTDRAVDVARARSASAGMRHALNGGRDTILDTVAADRRAKGWARVAGGSACAFCAMLASRGPVYKGDTASFEAHDHCSCSVEAVYRDDAEWPANARRYRGLWDAATTDVRGSAERLAAFRSALTAG